MRRAPLLAALALVLAGCTGGPDDAPPAEADASGGSGGGGSGVSGTIDVAPAPEESTQTAPLVEIRSFAFAPASLNVGAGSVVRWTNLDAAPHQVEADAAGWTSPRLDEGESFEQAFPTRGTFAYHCPLHPNMKGTVVVGDGAPAQAPTPVPTPTPSPAKTSPTPAPTKQPTPTPRTSPTPAPASSAPTSSPTPSQSPPPQQQASTPKPVAVGILDGSFSPASVTVPVGTTVTWTNRDDGRHTVTAQDGSFASGRLSEGQTFSQTFSQTGSYPYFCALHGDMRAVIAVA